MSEQHWLLHNQKAHYCQPLPGEPQFLTRCGKRVHPLFLKQPKENDVRCKLCVKSVESLDE